MKKSDLEVFEVFDVTKHFGDDLPYMFLRARLYGSARAKGTAEARRLLRTAGLPFDEESGTLRRPEVYYATCVFVGLEEIQLFVASLKRWRVRNAGEWSSPYAY